MSNAPERASWREGRSPFRAIGLLLALYFVTRALSLNALPIFLDEAVHLQWADRLVSEGRILRPVGSGRLLAVLTYGLALPFEDRLWAARLIASMAGALTLAFTMLLSNQLFGRRASVIAGVLYVLSPFALVYDRLALSDGFLSACLTALMFATGRLIQDPTAWPRRAAVALLVTLAILSKVSAPLFFLTIPLAVAAMAPDRRAALRAVIVAGALGFLCASPMLWFFAANSGEIVSQHVVDPAAVGSITVATLLDMREWVLSYFTLPALLAAAASALLLRDGRVLWLAGSVALPFVLFALFSQPWSARYVLPTLPPLLVLISGGVDRVASRLRPDIAAAVLLTGLTSSSFFSFDRALLLDPARAPFPFDDKLQLVTGWPSGYGVRDIAARLEHEAEGGPTLVYVDTGGTRTLSTSLAVLLGRHPWIRLIEGDLESASFRDLLIRKNQGPRVFVVLGPHDTGFDIKSLLASLGAEKLEAYQRPGGEWAGTLFQLTGSANPMGPPATDERLF